MSLDLKKLQHTMRVSSLQSRRHSRWLNQMQDEIHRNSQHCTMAIFFIFLFHQPELECRKKIVL